MSKPSLKRVSKPSFINCFNEHCWFVAGVSAEAPPLKILTKNELLKSQLGIGKQNQQPQQPMYPGSSPSQPQQPLNPDGQSVPLPVGWISQFDTTSGKYFFVGTRSGRSQWEDPRNVPIQQYAPPPPQVQQPCQSAQPSPFNSLLKNPH